MPDFDLTVIGSGPGGYVAAIHAARMGASVAILEQDADEWGGTCLNHGCIPTKTLVQCAEVLRTVQRAREFGVSVAPPSVDWAAMQSRKDWVVGGMRRGVRSLLEANGVEMITARGRLAGGTRVSADGRELESRAVLLAPGSSVALPPIPGVELCLTSDTILQLDHVPTSLMVIGGGVVGMEFAGIFSLLGARVTVVEMLDQILTPVEPQVAMRFVKLMGGRSVEIHLDARVEEIARDGELLRLRFASGAELRAQQVLVATGRRPNTDDLGLEVAGVATEKGAIQVDGHMRTSADGIYAIGDATGISMLAHTASYQGEVAVANALGEKRITADYTAIPACIYTEPEIAYVGLSEAQARARGEQVKVGQFPFSALGRAMVLGETEGLVRVVTDADDYLLGVTIMGPRATDLIAEAALALNAGITAAELSHVVHAHPTLPEALAEAALDVGGRAVHIAPRRRSG
ncbi:MAG TPA: dihydrolipoyl dehydrogenase [Candidatus Dormibacteraeota bacterium]|nr:dihydrolipoyl dehydrogenase [Candidatus Dormibacteraeota bacterium]